MVKWTRVRRVPQVVVNTIVAFEVLANYVLVRHLQQGPRRRRHISGCSSSRKIGRHLGKIGQAQKKGKRAGLAEGVFEGLIQSPTHPNSIPRVMASASSAPRLERLEHKESEEWVSVGPESIALVTAPLQPIAVAASAKAGDKDVQFIYDFMANNVELAITSRGPNTFVPLFHADLGSGGSIAAEWMRHLSPTDKQEWNCRACRQFLERYGDLCVIAKTMTSMPPSAPKDCSASSSSSATTSATTSETPPVRTPPMYYLQSVLFGSGPHFSKEEGGFDGLKETDGELASIMAIRARFHANQTVREAFTVPVESVRHTVPVVLGKSKDGAWQHMCAKFPTTYLKNQVLRDCDYAQHHEMLTATLERNTLPVVEQALHLLQHTLPYAEKHRFPLESLYNLQCTLATTLGHKGMEKQRALCVWDAATTLPTGSIHALCNGGILGSLLTWIREGTMTDDQVRQAWEAIAGPTVYMRPTEAPKAGTLVAAEKALAAMGITPQDLVRRFLVESDVDPSHFVYREPVRSSNTSATSSSSNNSTAAASSPSLFGHVQARKDKAGSVPLAVVSKTMSFSAFLRTLMDASSGIVPIKVEFWTTAQTQCVGLITGNKGTYPLMQWHHADNLASPYQYHGTGIGTWNLAQQTWIPVQSILPLPFAWKKQQSQESQQDTSSSASSSAPATTINGFELGYVFTSLQARDTTPLARGGLFPTYLKTQFHVYRSVFEAHSLSSEGVIRPVLSDQVALCGPVVFKTDRAFHPVRVRVTTMAPGAGARQVVTVYDCPSFE